MNPRRIRCLVVKELAQIRRDRELMRLLIVAPILQLIILGFAATTDIREIKVAVRDRDRSADSRELTRSLAASGYFRVLDAAGPEDADGRLLVNGRAGLVLTIPRNFGRALAAGEPAPLQVLVDGADSNFGVQGLNYLQKATRQFAQGRMEQRAARGAPRPPVIAVESRAWYNPGLVSRVFMVPAIMALLLLVTTMVVASMALVREREEGTMEQLLVTPLRPAELIAGKLLPFVIIGFVEIFFALAAVFAVFQLAPRGSLVTLLVMSGLFIMTTLGLGLFVSTLVKTQQQAMLVSAFFIMMPFVMLSGFAFPVENMPRVIQLATNLIPLKFYITIVRAIYLKGAGWPELWPHAAMLLGWGAAILGLAIAKFHKRLD